MLPTAALCASALSSRLLDVGGDPPRMHCPLLAYAGGSRARVRGGRAHIIARTAAFGRMG